MSDLAALGSLFNGSLTGKREQRIHTPIEIVNGLRRLWPAGVACDPCGSPLSLVGARTTYYPEQEDPDLRDGLTVDWPLYSYVNPPYDNLRPWLSRFSTSDEVVALVPWRSHRTWFRAAIASCSAVSLLAPLKFAGFDHSFPAPLCLLYRGSDVGGFCSAFDTLGDYHRGPIGTPSPQETLF